MAKHIATATNFVGLGVEVDNMLTIASNLYSEMGGLKVSHRIPPMTTVILQNYGFKVTRSKAGKDAARKRLITLADTLGRIINNEENDRLEVLEKAMTESRHKFFLALTEMAGV